MVTRTGGFPKLSIGLVFGASDFGAFEQCFPKANRLRPRTRTKGYHYMYTVLAGNNRAGERT